MFKISYIKIYLTIYLSICFSYIVHVQNTVTKKESFYNANFKHHTTISSNILDIHGRVIWDYQDNLRYNNDVIVVGKDTMLSILKNQTKVKNPLKNISSGSITIAALKKEHKHLIFKDKAYISYGHNNKSLTTYNSTLVKNFGVHAKAYTQVHATPLQRVWKVVVTDTVPIMEVFIAEDKLSLSKKNNKQYIMLVSDDETFTTNVTSISMFKKNSMLKANFHFTGVKYIAFATTKTTAPSAKSLSFNALNTGYLTAGNVNNLNSTSFTISAWIKRNNQIQNADIISKIDYTGSFTNGYAITITNKNKIEVLWSDMHNNTINKIGTLNDIPANQWHHIAVTFNLEKNVTNLFLDGQLEKSVSNLKPLKYANNAHFMIGASNYLDSKNHFKGEIDEVRIWKIALSKHQIQFMMNQEIIKSSTALVTGKIIPSNNDNNISTLKWKHLIAYYPINRLVFGSVKDESMYNKDLSMHNYTGLHTQTAPLPYKTNNNGDWSNTSTWLHGDVQYIPGYNTSNVKSPSIVIVNHNINIKQANTNVTAPLSHHIKSVLGLHISKSGTLVINGNTDSNTGSGLLISHYLKLDGMLDLEGESQLIQPEGSTLDSASIGKLQRDQQGINNTYVYNYWSSPVGANYSMANNNSFRLSDNIIKDGTKTATPQKINFLTTSYNGFSTPNSISIADFWIYKYTNSLRSYVSAWQQIRSTGLINAGEGFTMKGVDNSKNYFTSSQNLIFEGKPNNGNIQIMLAKNNTMLVGNPYPSAIDANQFILDNIKDGAGRASNNIINGAIYFLDHFALNTHTPSEYNGGYAVYTLLGGVATINNISRLHKTNFLHAETPGRYIPVSQGFFVTAKDGGHLRFKNSQRIFKPEGSNNSVFMKQSFKHSINNKNNIEIDTREKIVLKINSPKGYLRQLLVGVDSNCTNNFDIGYDAELIENNVEDFYWLSDNKKLVIQAVKNFSTSQTLSIGYKTKISGNITFSIATLENFSNSKTIVLHDKDRNVYHNLQQSAYNIYSEKGNFDKRFNLIFTDAILATENTHKNLHITAKFFRKNKEIIITNPTNKYLETIVIYNILGQKIIDLPINTNHKEYRVRDKNQTLKPGNYIIKLTADSHVITNKLNVRG